MNSEGLTDMPYPRREFLKAALNTGVVCSILCTSRGNKVLAAHTDPETNRLFGHGVASGDPTHDSVLLWTRVSVSGSAFVEW